MWAKEKSYDKWHQPGWRIEQRYSNKVLIGNWVEERLQFNRDVKKLNSTHRQDYRPQWGSQPDTFVRRMALRRGEGLPGRLLLAHHNVPSSHFLVTQYDEMFGRRVSTVPSLRSWDSNKLAWAPERSDFAAREPPTNLGLAEMHQRARAKESWRSEATPATSAYCSAFLPPPVSALRRPCHANAPQRAQSGRVLGTQLPPIPGLQGLATTAPINISA